MVNALERAPDLDVILELDCHLVIDERLEKAASLIRSLVLDDCMESYRKKKNESIECGRLYEAPVISRSKEVARLHSLHDIQV